MKIAFLKFDFQKVFFSFFFSFLFQFWALSIYDTMTSKKFDFINYEQDIYINTIKRVSFLLSII